MNDARWQQIDALFEQALEVDPERRAVFVEQESGSDDKLRRAVDRLLALEVEAASFLAEPIAALSAPMKSEPGGVLGEVRIGPYRLVRPLGHGGMGSVYLARREDEYQQEVAIKLVRQGFLSEEVRRRFENERQVLARLEHPNIARLYDGGTTVEGLPYLVMERVEGLPIDRFCDQQQLVIRQRLELFRQVCAAVATAHRCLLVHCDLKPSNILVTVDGTPKLLDFGIAKMLRSDGLDETTLTRGLRPMTPGYASPEQILGESITTASDVYSLGVILYKLLCGSLPFVASGDCYVDFGSAVVDQEAEKPSRRVLVRPATGSDDVDFLAVSRRRRTTPTELSRKIRGDLDAIVLRALRPMPEQRYVSVNELSSDVGRHLAALPVRARRGTWRYRTGRLLRRMLLPPDPRRRRERLLWVSLLVAAVTASWAVSSLQHPVISCDDAVGRLVGVWDSQVQTTIHNAFIATGLPFAGDVWRRIERTLGDYAEAWVAMHDETCEATHIRGEQSEQMLDVRMICLDGRREELRAITRLLAEADQGVVKEAHVAVGALQPIVVCADRSELSNLELPPDDPFLRRRIDNLLAIAEEQLARWNTKRPVDTETLRQAIETASDLPYRPALARALFVLGTAESFEGGNPQAGLEHLEKALLAAIAGGDRRLQTRIYAALVSVEIRLNGNAEGAQRWEGYAEASLEALSNGNDDLLYEVARAAGLLAFETGQLAESKAHYARALDIADKGADPARRIAALANRGMFGETDYLEQAIEVTRREFGTQNVNMVRPLQNLAAEYAYQGRHDTALPLVHQAVELLEATYGDQYPDLAFPLVLGGQILSAKGRPAEALPYLQRAQALLEVSRGREAPLVADVRHALADALRWLGRHREALDHALAADQIYAATRPQTHYSRRALLGTIGSIQRELGDLPAALESHGQLLEMLRDPAGTPGDQSGPLLAIGETFLDANRGAEAGVLLEQAFEQVRSSAEPLNSARIRFALARAIKADAPARARQLAQDAVAGLSADSALGRELKERVEVWLRQPR